MLHGVEFTVHQTNFDSYDLPQRIHTAKTYPLQSTNGSTVIIYGQENGVKIVWRGGRQFKAPKETHASNNKTNGSADVVMLLDSDDESPAPAFVDKPEFEAYEEEYHPTKPYPQVLQVLDLYFGTEVLNIETLSSSILKADGASWRSLDGIKQKIIFVAACADNKVRIITLPLTPPSPTSKARPEFRSNPTLSYAGNGSWGETVVELHGHQKPPTGAAVTVDLTNPDQTDSKSATPQLVIASHSRGATGYLLLHKVPLSLPSAVVYPCQTVALPSPAKSLAFNTSLSAERSSHLLVSDSIGVCRIYDYKLVAKASSEEQELEGPINEQGTWLLSLYTGGQSAKSEPQSQQIGSRAGFGRKAIMDAKWVSGGKAVIALLSDGQWIVWDIEGVGRETRGGTLRQGLQGGSCSEVAISGYIEIASKTRSMGASQTSTSKFAPMTPGTRKTTEMFSGKVTTSPARGQLSVLEYPGSSPTSLPEESIAFWFGDTFSVIPNLSKYWSANARKAANGSNLFNGAPGGRVVRVEGVNLQGEKCSGIEQISKSTGSPRLPSDLLVLGEHRFVIVDAGQAPSFGSSMRTALVERNPDVSGGLELSGIEQALELMDSPTQKNGYGARSKRG